MQYAVDRSSHFAIVWMVGGGVGFGKSLCRQTNSHVSGNTEGFYI